VLSAIQSIGAKRGTFAPSCSTNSKNTEAGRVQIVPLAAF
jgi:hypothetical protein